MDPVPQSLLTLAAKIRKVASLKFHNPNIKTFTLDENCIGEARHNSDPQVFCSPTFPLVVRHAGSRIDFFASERRTTPIRILIVDYHVLSRKRQILGHIMIHHVPGDVKICDYRHPISVGIIPECFKSNLGYILGIQFDQGVTRIRAQLTLFDRAFDFLEELVFVRISQHQTYISCNSAISERVEVTGRPDVRYPERPVEVFDTIVRPRTAVEAFRNTFMDVPPFDDYHRIAPTPNVSSDRNQEVRDVANAFVNLVVNEINASSTPVVHDPSGSVHDPATGAVSRSLDRSVRFSEKDDVRSISSDDIIVEENIEISAHSLETHSCNICEAILPSESELESHYLSHEATVVTPPHEILLAQSLANRSVNPDWTEEDFREARRVPDPRYPYWTEPESDTPLPREETLRRQALERFQAMPVLEENVDDDSSVHDASILHASDIDTVQDNVTIPPMSDYGSIVGPAAIIVPAVAEFEADFPSDDDGIVSVAGEIDLDVD